MIDILNNPFPRQSRDQWIIPTATTGFHFGVCLAIALSFTALASISFAKDSPAKPREKILTFPNERSYGNLSKVLEISHLDIHVKKSPLGEARGTVRFPAGTKLYYVPGPKFFQNPQILLKLPPDSIEYIKMQFTSMDDAEDRMSDRAVPYLRHLTALEGVDFDKSDTTDAGAAKLDGMPNLKGISTSESAVTGTFLKALSTCPKMEFIRFGAVQVNIDSLQNLKNFKHLRRLVLTRCGLTDAAAVQIAACPTLEQLDLSFNPSITDKTLAKLATLKKLENLNLRDTGISIAAIKAFAAGKKVTIVMPKMRALYSKAELAEIKKIPANLEFDFDHTKNTKEVHDLLQPINRK